jgi:hypothetical protein
MLDLVLSDLTISDLFIYFLSIFGTLALNLYIPLADNVVYCAELILIFDTFCVSFIKFVYRLINPYLTESICKPDFLGAEAGFEPATDGL